MSNTSFDYYANRRHEHDHAHDEHAPLAAEDEGPPSEYEVMSRAMQELLEAKGFITADEVRSRMEQFDELLVAHRFVEVVDQGEVHRGILRGSRMHPP